MLSSQQHHLAMAMSPGASLHCHLSAGQIAMGNSRWDNLMSLLWQFPSRVCVCWKARQGNLWRREMNLPHQRQAKQESLTVTRQLSPSLLAPLPTWEPSGSSAACQEVQNAETGTETPSSEDPQEKRNGQDMLLVHGQCQGRRDMLLARGQHNTETDTDAILP